MSINKSFSKHSLHHRRINFEKKTYRIHQSDKTLRPNVHSYKRKRITRTKRRTTNGQVRACDPAIFELIRKAPPENCARPANVRTPAVAPTSGACICQNFPTKKTARRTQTRAANEHNLHNQGQPANMRLCFVRHCVTMQ